MRAGQLRHRVTILAPTRTTDARSGQAVLTWSSAAEVWAWMRPATSREVYQAQQNQLQITHTCTMRYASLVTGERRIRHDGIDYDVVGVLNVDGRNRELNVQCLAITKGS